MEHPTMEEEWSAYLDELLIAAGANLRASVPVEPAAIAAAKRKALARLSDKSLSLRLGSLHLLLAPMCGAQTSTRAIRAAAQRVSADSPRTIAEHSWPGFVENLHAIVAMLCGEPAARLVRERGMQLQQEAA